MTDRKWTKTKFAPKSRSSSALTKCLETTYYSYNQAPVVRAKVEHIHPMSLPATTRSNLTTILKRFIPEKYHKEEPWPSVVDPGEELEAMEVSSQNLLVSLLDVDRLQALLQVLGLDAAASILHNHNVDGSYFCELDETSLKVSRQINRIFSCFNNSHRTSSSNYCYFGPAHCKIPYP